MNSEIGSIMNRISGEHSRNGFFLELQENQNVVDGIISDARNGTVTLLSGSKEERFNNAVALKEYIDSRMNAAERTKAA